MKKVLVIVFNNMKYDARVSRQVGWLKDEFRITLASYGHSDPEVDNIVLKQPKLTFFNKVKLGLFLLLKRYTKAYWQLYPYKSLADNISFTPDMIIANDVETLPLAFKISSKAKIPVYFDAHEYAPRHFEDKLWFKLFFQSFNIFLCKKYLPKVAGMSTVSPGLVREYKNNFPVDPILILNAPKYYGIQPEKTTRPVRIIHHGGATISRKIEKMIKMMSFLDENYQLDLMLLIPPRASKRTRSYVDKLKFLAKDNNRINFIAPVEHHQVVDFIKNYDLGLFLLEPVNFNYRYTVPNKLLEFIQAGLATAIGPSPDMKTIVEEHNCGIVAADFKPETLANKIMSYSLEELDTLKKNASSAAKKLNADHYKEIFIREIRKILTK